MPANNPVTKIEEERQCYYFRISRDANASFTNHRWREKGEKGGGREEEEHKKEYNWFVDKVEQRCSNVNRVGT